MRNLAQKASVRKTPFMEIRILFGLSVFNFGPKKPPKNRLIVPPVEPRKLPNISLSAKLGYVQLTIVADPLDLPGVSTE